MSTPFPPKSKLNGLSAYAPPRVRDRAFSEEPAEDTDTSAQREITQSETGPEAEESEFDHALMAQDAGAASESDTTTDDALAWLDDAIREVIALKHLPDAHAEPAVTAPYAPSITPIHDENDEAQPPTARPLNSGPSRPRPPRLETQIVPPPPAQTRESGQLGMILRIFLAIVFAAFVAYGVTLFYPLRPGAPQPSDSAKTTAEAGPQQAEIQAPPQTPSRLLVEDRQAFANEPLALAVNIEHAAEQETLLLDGLVQGTTLSAGTPIGPSRWQLTTDKLQGLYMYAPKDFVGVMNTTVNLLGRDSRLLDSRAMQLKWISKPISKPPQRAPQPAIASAGSEAPTGIRIEPAPPPAPAIKPIDPSEAAMLMQRGRDFLGTGDISAARVAFRRLADAGMPDAALALANTYDPGYLAAHNVVGVSGDSAMARALYRRAKQLGSAEAGQILARMGAN
jgi:hypothetical protein